MTWIAVGVYVTLAPVAIFELTHRERAAGFMQAVYAVATGSGALLTGRLMDRVGRRPGLAVGAALLAIGALGCAASVVRHSAAGLIASSIAYGAGMGACLLSRGAVADMYEPERRGRAVGVVLAAGTAGAIGGPPVVGLLRRTARTTFDADPLAVPWLLVPVCAVVILLLVAAVRPDPRDLAVDATPAQARMSALPLLRTPAILAATLSMVVAQTTMVSTMGMTPIVLHRHGTSEFAISGVVSTHLAGMFALAPVVGWVLDRAGRRPVLMAGALVSATGALVGTRAGHGTSVWLGMFLVGLGWSAAYLGSTAVISDATLPEQRAGALGMLDLFASGASAVGALCGGFLVETSGFDKLGTIMALAGIPALLLWVRTREPLRTHAAGSPAI